MLRTDCCIRRPQYTCKLLWWHGKVGEKENLSLGQIAACISNGKQIKVKIIFVALLCCQWPLLNGVWEGGDRWILPHQPYQDWRIFGSHRNTRTKKRKKKNPTTKPSNKMHVRVLLFSGLAEVKNTRKKLFRVLGGSLCWKFGRKQERCGTAEMIWTKERRIWPHTHKKKEIQRECMWELLPLFNRNRRGRGEGTLAGCTVLHRVLFKSRIRWGKKHFHPRLEKETSYLKPNTPELSSATAFASEENFIKKRGGIQ